MAKPVHVLIVTAARGEDDAVRSVDDGGLGKWQEETEGPEGYPFDIWLRDYKIQHDGTMRAALTRAYGMGVEATGNAAARLVDFYKPQCLAMCGVCAGNPKRARLGDVIVGDRLYRYDVGAEVKSTPESNTIFLAEITTYKPPAQWIRKAEQFQSTISPDASWLLDRPRPLELQALWVLSELAEGADPMISPERATMCTDWKPAIEYLQRKKLLRYSKGDPVLTAAGKSYIREILNKNLGKLPEQDPWAIRVGPLGTGSKLKRDITIWDQLAITQYRICGLDMEASAIGLAGYLHDVPMIVAKGVMDYGEPDRNDIFRPFAARAAAEVLIGFLRQHLEPKKGKSPAEILSENIYPPRRNGSPATLLNARSQVVPFFPEIRDTELKDLEQWHQHDSPVSARLFVGAGGSGKTRLFIEWARRMREQGWFAGFVEDEPTEEDIEVLLTSSKPTLVVIDYAESRPWLGKFLRQVAKRSSQEANTLRVALLARDVADWWEAQLESDHAIRRLLTEYEPTRLANISVDGPLRVQVWERAYKAFAPGKPVPAAKPDLSDKMFGRPLYLHMSALATLEDPKKKTPAHQLLDEIVSHEKRFWFKQFRKQAGDNLQDHDFSRRASRMMAAVTLRGGVWSFEEAAALNQRVKGPTENLFVEFLRSLYPEPLRKSDDLYRKPRYLVPVVPEPLGECLIAGALRDVNTPRDYLERVFEGADEPALRTGFIILTRLSIRYPKQGAEWVRKFLDRDVIGRATAAFDACLAVCSESAHAGTGLALAEALAGAKAFEPKKALELARSFEGRVPHRTVSLREVALWSTEKLLEYIPVAIADEPSRIERARLLNSLGAILGELGRYEAALQTANEALAIRRDLAKTRPDAFLPDLAMSLNNLGLRLSALGRREEALAAAEEGTKIYRELAKSRPDAFLPDLARCLNNLGAILGKLGRLKAALDSVKEATNIYRELAESRPDTFLPDLAGSLNNLGTILGELGRPEAALDAAEEAAAIRRELARSRPDSFLPDLAGILNNLGGRLSALGRREKALAAADEATKIYRDLAKTRPDAFLPDLAMSLNNLGNRLGELGHREEALEAMGEAVAIRRKLSETRPDAFLPYLAMSLKNLGVMLSELGRREEALAAAEEATSIYRELAKFHPDALLYDLAASPNIGGKSTIELVSKTRANPVRTRGKSMPHVFVSYVSENAEEVTRLCQELTDAGVHVWLDRQELPGGARWKDEIRRAIREGDFFIACFSKDYSQRTKSYMNEELTLAVEELLKIPRERKWFIPLRLSECDIPEIPISGNESLKDIQWVDLFPDWQGGINRIVTAILPNRRHLKPKQGKSPDEMLSENVYQLLPKDSPATILNARSQAEIMTRFRSSEPISSDAVGEIPLTINAAIAKVKEYIENNKQISLSDLVTGQTEQLVSHMQQLDQSTISNLPQNSENLKTFLDTCERQTEILQAIIGTGCYWGRETHRKFWVECLQRIVNAADRVRRADEEEAPGLYPALLLLYAGAIGAIGGQRYENLRILLHEVHVNRGYLDGPATILLHTCFVLGPRLAKLIYDSWWFPFTERFRAQLCRVLQGVVPDEENLAKCLDKFEYLQSLDFIDFMENASEECLFREEPLGEFAIKYHRSRSRESDRKPPRESWNIIEEVAAEAQSAMHNWLPLKAGFFGGSFERFETSSRLLNEIIKEIVISRSLARRRC
jgi:tetratricopeptide (TPR) repeat protein/nucleoside phosphorylase